MHSLTSSTEPQRRRQQKHGPLESTSTIPVRRSSGVGRGRNPGPEEALGQAHRSQRPPKSGVINTRLRGLYYLAQHARFIITRDCNCIALLDMKDLRTMICLGWFYQIDHSTTLHKHGQRSSQPEPNSVIGSNDNRQPLGVMLQSLLTARSHLWTRVVAERHPLPGYSISDPVNTNNPRIRYHGPREY